MSKLIQLYNSTGRAGNILLLILLILSGFFSRFLVAVKYREIDYIIEGVIIFLTAFLVFRIFKNSVFEFNRQKIFKWILIAGIVFRTLLAVHDFYDRPVQDSDYEKHEKLGYRIAFENSYYDFVGVELRNFRQPGLPAIFALGLWIYNDPSSYAAVMILFSFGVLVSGYYLFRGIKNTAAFITFAYIALAPNMLFMASNSNTQLSFFFFLILLFIVLKNYDGRLYQLIIIGLLLAAEMYVRFNFLMIFLLVPFLLEKHRDENYFYVLKKFGLVFAFFLLAYSPWIYRNYQVYGTLKLMPNSEGLRLYTSNVIGDYTKAGGYNGIPDTTINKFKHLPETEFDEALKNEALSYIADNPGLYLKGLPFRLIKYSGRQDWTIGYFFEYTEYSYGKTLNLILQNIDNFFFWMILFIPLIMLYRNKNLSPLAVYILWSYLIYSLIVLPISETRSRYNFPYLLFPVIAVSLSNGRSKEDVSAGLTGINETNPELKPE